MGTVSPYPVDRPVDSYATIGFALSIVALFVFAPVGIAAIVLGRKGQARIEASHGERTGEGMAKAAVVMGAAALVIWGIAAIIIAVVAWG